MPRLSNERGVYGCVSARGLVKESEESISETEDGYSILQETDHHSGSNSF